MINHQLFGKCKFRSMKLFFRILVIITLMVLSFNGLILYARHNNKQILANLSGMVLNDPKVLNVEVEIDSVESLLTKNFYNVKIIFNDGGSMKILDVDKWGKEPKEVPMIIYCVNGYGFTFVNINEGLGLLTRHMELWSIITGVQLETIKDIVEHYDIISEHIEKWINLSDYKQDDDMLFLTRSRVIAENLYTDTIMFDGEEYVLLKYSLLTKWSDNVTKEKIRKGWEYIESFLESRDANRSVK